MKGTIRNLILFICIGGALAFGFYYFFKKDDVNLPNLSSSATNSDSTGTSAGTVVGADGIRLDTSIFSNPAFLSLRDSSVILIPRGNEGRPNPFAPIGRDDVANPTLSSAEELESELDDTTTTTTNKPN